MGKCMTMVMRSSWNLDQSYMSWHISTTPGNGSFKLIAERQIHYGKMHAWPLLRDLVWTLISQTQVRDMIRHSPLTSGNFISNNVFFLNNCLNTYTFWDNLWPLLCGLLWNSISKTQVWDTSQHISRTSGIFNLIVESHVHSGKMYDHFYQHIYTTSGNFLSNFLSINCWETYTFWGNAWPF